MAGLRYEQTRKSVVRSPLYRNQITRRSGESVVRASDGVIAIAGRRWNREVQLVQSGANQTCEGERRGFPPTVHTGITGSDPD